MLTSTEEFVAAADARARETAVVQRTLEIAGTRVGAEDPLHRGGARALRRGFEQFRKAGSRAAGFDVFRHRPDRENTVGLDDRNQKNEPDREGAHHAARERGSVLLESRRHHATRILHHHVVEDVAHVQHEREQDVVEVEANVGFLAVNHTINRGDDKRQSEEAETSVERLVRHVSAESDRGDAKDDVRRRRRDVKYIHQQIQNENQLRTEWERTSATELIRGTTPTTCRQ